MSLADKLYNHGSNCRVMKLHSSDAMRILEDTYYPNRDPSEVMTPEEFDSFWEGFYNGDSSQIVKID